MSPTPASSEENPLVHISAARLEQYRAHRQMVDQMFEQIGSFVNDLGTKGYPVKFERLSPKEGAQRAETEASQRGGVHGERTRTD